MNFPKYQISYFLEDGAQVVFRTDDYTEFVKESDRLKLVFIPKNNKPTPVVKPTNGVQKHVVRKDFCNIHNKEMKEKISKSSGRPYNAHYRKVEEEWDTCFGKGWVSEQEGQSSEQIAKRINEPVKGSDQDLMNEYIMH